MTDIVVVEDQAVVTIEAASPSVVLIESLGAPGARGNPGPEGDPGPQGSPGIIVSATDPSLAGPLPENQLWYRLPA